MTKSSVVFLLMLAIAFVGCKKDDPKPPERLRSFMHIVSGAPNKTFDITLDYYNADDLVIRDFDYHRNFPIEGYADLQAAGVPDEFGNGKLFLSAESQPFLNVPATILLEPMEIVLEEEQLSTLYFADSSGQLVFRKVADSYSFPTDSATAVRFINMSEDNPAANVTTSDGTLNFSGLPFLEATDFVNVARGWYEVEVRDSANAITSTYNWYMQAGSAYTLYLSGSGNGDLKFFIQ